MVVYPILLNVTAHCASRLVEALMHQNGLINVDDLKLTDRDKSLTFYQSSESKQKYFCKTCGAPIYSSNSQSSSGLRLRLGALDSDIVE